eukprot:CAMPEP_0171775988 /NCGR_PEP_ID=MMETSP0991-20121206/56857_1 /TAXON_ID=483369 /ORGANISM="non described non described, Strain CCMP2098" /LENGTH=59 /DNA_ID=CAMNT_0012382303 /DNA_START=105 /DNA_END=284 /DNA_ORIENTATION=+
MSAAFQGRRLPPLPSSSFWPSFSLSAFSGDDGKSDSDENDDEEGEEELSPPSRIQRQWS